MSIGLHAKRYNPWRSQWSPRRKVVTVTVTITTTGTNEIPNETLPQFLVRLCLCYNHHYACHHRFWVTDDCTLTEYFVVPFTVWSVCVHSLIGFVLLWFWSLLARLLFEPWTDHCCTTATSFLPCVPMYRSYLGVPPQNNRAATLLCGSGGGRASCLRQDAHPPAALL